MAKAENRPVILLACTECKERTYATEKNKKNDPIAARASADTARAAVVIHCTVRRSSRANVGA